MLTYKQFLERERAQKDSLDEDALFNFRWKQSQLDQLRALALKNGVTASSIIKNLLLLEFEHDASKSKCAQK